MCVAPRFSAWLSYLEPVIIVIGMSACFLSSTASPGEGGASFFFVVQLPLKDIHANLGSDLA